ncbi:hypothetical protein BMS3Abin03_01031 [bacterium BMS3Abin03]|nr:hypothetical protein BMS3Abin03_01031 [bacterium BMS3Abin03]
MSKSQVNIQIAVTHKMYLAILFGQLVLFAIALWFVETAKVEFSISGDDFFSLAVPLFGIIMMIVSKFIFTKKIAGIKKEKELILKLSKYRTAKIIVWAMVESASLFSIVLFMSTGRYYYAVVFILIVGYYLLNRPSRGNIVLDLQLSEEEKSIVLNR